MPSTSTFYHIVHAIEMNKISVTERLHSLHFTLANSSISLIDENLDTGELIIVPSLFLVETVIDSFWMDELFVLEKLGWSKNSCWGTSDNVVNLISLDF